MRMGRLDESAVCVHIETLHSEKRMTAKSASDLAIEIDAMRLAREQDHKECARLTARAKELETILRDGHSVTRHVDTHGICAWRRHVERVVGQVRDEAPRLADGTRDEEAMRCILCRTPIERGDLCRPCRMDAP